MKESELRTGAKEFAVNVLRVCDNVDSRKGMHENGSIEETMQIVYHLN